VTESGLRDPFPGHRRVLLLAYFYPPENASGAARPGRFAKYLPSFGYEVHVIANALEGGNGEAGVSRVPDRELTGGDRAAAKALEWFHRHVAPYNDRLPWIPHVVRQGRELAVAQRFDAILSTSPPAGAHLAARRLKRRFGWPWIADFRDPLKGNPFRTRQAGIPYDIALERMIFDTADLLVANTDSLAESWLRRYPQAHSRIRVLWNGYDPEDSFPREVAPPDGARSILSHVGSLYGPRRPDVLLGSVGRLVRSGRLDPSEIRMRFIGPVEAEIAAAIHREYADLDRMGVLECHGEVVSTVEARNAMLGSDQLLLLDLNGTGDSLQVPAKLFDYVRARRPILAFTPKESPTARILDKCGMPAVCIDPEGPEGAADERILHFLRSRHCRVEPSEWFQREFDGKRQAATLAAFLDEVLPGRAAGAHAPVPTVADAY
jgi:glycosyltransferase involved in cell wall biosynthesis